MGTLKSAKKCLKGSKGKGLNAVVKMKVENNSISICWENKQNIVVYLEQLTHKALGQHI